MAAAKLRCSHGPQYGSRLKALLASSFFSVRKTVPPATLQTDGAEDKALPGGNLSADSGAKTRLGFGVEPGPTNTIANWDWHQSDKSQGSRDRVPRERLSLALWPRLACVRLITWKFTHPKPIDSSLALM